MQKCCVLREVSNLDRPRNRFGDFKIKGNRNESAKTRTEVETHLFFFFFGFIEILLSMYTMFAKVTEVTKFVKTENQDSHPAKD